MTKTQDALLEANPAAMIKAEADNLAEWSDQKKADFVDTFKDRVRSARAILVETARRVASKAQSRKFISRKHMRPLESKHGNDFDRAGPNFNAYEWKEAGGRSYESLKSIADERAKTILDELPPLRKAVQWIDPDTVTLIDRAAKIKKLAQEATDELDDVCVPVIMAELDQDMSIGEFRKMIGDLDRKRKKILAQLAKWGHEGSSLESMIAKRLYAGLPGLSDAVVDAINEHLQRAIALDEMCRRVEEQVKFGDSEAAMEILRAFEADEVAVGQEFKDKIRAAVAVLKSSVKAPKALPKGKKRGKRRTK